MKAFWTPSLALLYLFFGAIDSMGQGIRVESAYYGSRDGVGVDVTGRVQLFADYGEPFRVSNDTLRIDPSPDRPKTLSVVYYVNGRRISETVPEGEVFYFRSGSSKRHLWSRPCSVQEKRLKIYFIPGDERREKEYREGDSVRFW